MCDNAQRDMVLNQAINKSQSIAQHRQVRTTVISAWE